MIPLPTPVRILLKTRLCVLAFAAMVLPAMSQGLVTPLRAESLSAFAEPHGEWHVAADVTLMPENPTLLASTAGTGVIVNGSTGRTKDILTKEDFGDVEVHIEFCVPKGSNSGVYLMGRYEIQVFDSFGVAEPEHSDCGGIYQRWENDQGFEGHAPRINASKPPGEWQSFDAVFLAPRFDGNGNKTAPARFVRVLHNGLVIHENVDVSGPTRASRWNDEKPLGPLMLQGDHGPVAYRNITIRPLPPGFSNPFFAMDTATKRSYPNDPTPPAEQLDLLKELGYNGIAWTADDPAKTREVAAAARARGMRMWAIYFEGTLTKDGIQIDPRLEPTLDVLRGHDTIIWLHLPSKDFTTSSPAGDAVAVPALIELADKAAQRGLRVAIYPHAGDWTERIQDAVRLAKKVNHPNFGVTFNLCHCLRVGDEARIPELLEQAAPHLFCVTVNGADSNATDPSWKQLIQTLDRGSFDLAPMLRKLTELKYPGPIGFQGYGIGGDPRDNLTRTINGWRNLLKKL
ncbi:MAG: DUF1080 domain-containing protein [Akkermansiaceae bacterium]|nr:DUF1080 domain-containing protein [Akkermansiaceae bacterium]MCF7731189.1 DUF1080 domain-containing protein [Akkermansiaceae bacterium]